MSAKKYFASDARVGLQFQCVRSYEGMKVTHLFPESGGSSWVFP